MVSSYTTRKRLEKQNPGENNNSWGSLLNQNMIDLIDECFGVVCVAMTTAGDSTLSQANGSSDEGRRSQIILTGAPSSNVRLFVPAVQSFYLVRNKMTGSNRVRLTNSGGTNGVDFSGSGSGAEQGLVVSDGTNVREVFRTTSAGSIVGLTSVVLGVVSDSTTDSTGGALTDFMPFLDASETGALNKVRTVDFLTNTLANVSARTSVSPSDTLIVGDSDGSFTAGQATVQKIHNAAFGLTAKTSIGGTDTIGITDGDASNAAKKITYDNFKSTLITNITATSAGAITGTDNSTFLTPRVVKEHHGVAKAWAVVDTTSPTLIATSGFSGIVKNGTGEVTLTFSTAMASVGYAAVVTIVSGANPSSQGGVVAAGTTSLRVQTGSANTGALIDSKFNIVVHGLKA